MKFVADVHLHSHYSRATSKDLDFEHLSRWAQLKGVHLVGTGDIAHPGWLQEMKDKLEPAEEGLFRLKAEVARPLQADLPPACRGEVRFMLAGEISNIYKKNGRTRKVHNVIFAPSLAVVEKIQAALEKIGNIRSDGRPILGLDSRDLLEIILEIDPQNTLIPAHIWTPWFSLLGSMSGFDSVEECFDDLTPHIFALETGLSSDPPMNWRVSALDNYTLVSNSDAHSPQKLAREANIFETDLAYPAFFAALKTGQGFQGTLEFFPEEGKYHLDGHRKCHICWEPPTTRQHQGLCAECGKAVTVGVMHRVETLADRPAGSQPPRARPFHSLIPLPEVLSEVLRVGAASRQVDQAYHTLLAQLGPELTILQERPLAEIERVGGPLLAEALRRMRCGELSIAAGYDGEYGVVKLFSDEERDFFTSQLNFLAPPKPPQKRKPASQTPPPTAAQENFGVKNFSFSKESNNPHPNPRLRAAAGEGVSQLPPVAGGLRGVFSKESTLLAGLNPAQQAAALCTDAPLLIIAGPGTGKTRTLTHRIAYLITAKAVAPENILAITFTNKAAAEMAHRLITLVGPEVVKRLTLKTFHALGAMILRVEAVRLDLSPQFALMTDPERLALLKRLYPDKPERELKFHLEQISAAKNRLLGPDSPDLGDPALVPIYQNYESALRQAQTLDFDDLILQAVNLFEADLALLESYRQRFRWISVDEYQDVNLAQYRLLRLLAGPEANLCAIGDPDQAIYGFRGADVSHFLAFQQDFPGAKVLRLSQNYRSTQLILAASGQVITRNSDSQGLELRSDILDPTRLELYQAASDKAEAEYVVHSIERLVGGTSYFSLDSGRVGDEESHTGRNFADFAVLYRLGAQSQALQEAFDRSGIPYQTVGQTPLGEYKEIKAILAGLWLRYNPDLPLYQAQMAPLPAGVLNHLPPEGSVALLVELLGGQLSGLNPKQAERIERLKLRAVPFEARLADFLEATLLSQETDAYDPRADRVTLMTLHAAKGLEFPVVFIVGCEEGLLPYQRGDEPVDVAEERRLFYVGMTRAQQKLILTHAKNRFLFGQALNHEPSHFLSDIELALKELKAAAYKPVKPKPENPQLKLF